MRVDILRTILPAPCLLLCLLAGSVPAACEEVKLADLEGRIVEAKFSREQVVRRAGLTFPVRIDGNWRIAIKPEKQLDVTYKATAHTPRGTREAKPISGTVTLDEPGRTPAGGQRLWTFADGTLTLVRTYEAGAYRIAFSFAGNADGPTCKVKEAFAREGGTGEIKLDSPFGGGQVTIVRAKQVSASCKVGKAVEPVRAGQQSRVP